MQKITNEKKETEEEGERWETPRKRYRTKPKKIFENKTADEEGEAEEDIKERKNKNSG